MLQIAGRLKSLILVAALLAMTGATENAFGQRGGGGDGVTPRGSGGNGPTTVTGSGEGFRKPAELADEGSARFTFITFKLDETPEPDEPVGRLNARPSEGGKLTIFRVPERAELRFGDRVYTPVQFDDLLANGMSVELNWSTKEDGRRKTKILEFMSFATIEIEGEVKEFDAEKNMLEVRALPTGGQPWPDQEEKFRNAKIKPKITPRIVRLKAVQDASKIEDELGRSLSLIELQEGKKITANVAYSMRGSLVQTLQVGLTDEEKSAANDRPKGMRGDPPPGRGRATGG